MRAKFPDVTFNVFQIQNIRDLSNTSILVNTTPIGMKGNSMDLMPIDISDIVRLNNNCIVYDVIYNPTKTKLLDYAQKRGLKTIGGLDMLIHQAAKAQEIWIGKLPDTQAMKIAALEALL